MALHDPELTKAYDANRAAISIASISETALRNFMAMTPAERRYKHEVASMQAIRHDLLARRNDASSDYHRDCAANARRTADALKAVGL